MPLHKRNKEKITAAPAKKKAGIKKELKKLPSKTPVRKKAGAFTIDLNDKEKDYRWLIESIRRDLGKPSQSPMPFDLKPMLASITDEPFNDAEWQFEIKWDGYRALAYLNKGEVLLKSRNNLSFNQKYPPLIDALGTWAINAVIDGEIVVLNEEGKANFNAMQEWHKTREGELIYYIFDILWLEGMDLTSLPLSKRQEILKKIAPDHGNIRFSDSIDEYGIEFFDIAKKNGLEGIIAKRKDAPYLTGYRTKTWYKVKAETRHEAVICGYTKKKDSDRLFSALVLGIYNKGVLKSIGLVGTGFTQAVQEKLLKKMRPFVTKTCPFETVPNTGAPVVWLRPELVCEVKYTELTKEGVMRHPSFQGIREDKTVTDLNDETDVPKTREVIQPANGAANTVSENKLFTAEEENQLVTIDRQPLKFTNLKKIYWPAEGFTKGDLLNYYHAIAPYILPYMNDRPQSLNRHPNGINGQSFYQKNMAGSSDKWLTTFRRVSESSGGAKYFLVCTSEASLLYMANLGCIEMNPWHSRVKSPHNPDWSVIDLDPGDISFEKVIEAAQVVKSVLDSLRIVSYPKTSGSTGIHIYIPLGARYSYDQSKQFAELVANIVHQELPDTTSIERNPLKRKDKIYLDYLQNRPIQTICAPYAVRPKPGATVSAPLHWQEVKKGLAMDQFTMNSIFERLKAEGDLFTGVLGEGVDLNRSLKKLSALMT